MSYTKLNRSAATLTKNRTEGSISPFSGMCVTCVDGCIGMCEIGKSAYRGHEVLYPQPFGIVTAGEPMVVEPATPYIPPLISSNHEI